MPAPAGKHPFPRWTPPADIHYDSIRRNPARARDCSRNRPTLKGDHHAHAGTRSCEDRNGLATATLRDHANKTVMSDFAAVSASSAIAARQGNRSCSPKRAWGHAPAGAYLLSGHARNTGAPRAKYGDDLFLFRVWFNRVVSATNPRPRGTMAGNTCWPMAARRMRAATCGARRAISACPPK